MLTTLDKPYPANTTMTYIPMAKITIAKTACNRIDKLSHSNNISFNFIQLLW